MLKLKSFLSSILVLAVCLSLSVPVFAITRPPITSSVAFASSVVENYYRNREVGESNDISTFMSEELFALLNTKIELIKYQNAKLNLNRSYYQVQIIPLNEGDWIITDDTISMKLQALRTWYYEGNSEITTSSDALDITLQKNSDDSYLMTGCYTSDYCSRFGVLDQEYVNSLNQRNSADTLSAYSQTFKAECDTKARQMESDKQMSQNVNKDVQTAALSDLNRNDAKDWARNNYYENEPVSSTSSVPYYDFSELTNNYDCTNFVSHALLAGGAALHDDGGSGIVGTDQWYYRSLANRSSSWAGVNQLKLFLVRSNPSSSNIGPYAEEVTLNYANAFYGDVVQYHNGSIWRHSTVVTSYDGGVIHVTGRTSDGNYNDNVPATEMSGTARLLHISGIYE